MGNNIDFYVWTLNVLSARQALLASNIANADTPHYRARDIDFRKALADALDGENKPLPLAGMSPQHLPGVPRPTLNPQVFYRIPLQPGLDGNTVDLDIERAQMADNTIRYEFALTRLNGAIKGFLSAIQG